MLCAKFCPDSPYSLVIGGEKNGFHVINVSSLPQGIIVLKQFACNSLFHDFCNMLSYAEIQR